MSGNLYFQELKIDNVASKLMFVKIFIFIFLMVVVISRPTCISS